MALRSAIPCAAFLAVGALVSMRTATRYRYKPAPQWLLFAYGVHSHLQQVPILIGQIAFHWNGLRGRRRSLIEYRESHQPGP